MNRQVASFADGVLSMSQELGLRYGAWCCCPGVFCRTLGASSWNQGSRMKIVEQLHYQFVRTAGPLLAPVSQSDRIRSWFIAIV